MKKLIMLQGLPGSGKSTWAKDQQIRIVDEAIRDGRSGTCVVVNKDTIRAEMNEPWSREQEKRVVQLRDERIRAGFNSFGNITIISDDTNFHIGHERVLRGIAQEYGAHFEVKFFDVPLDECIRRVAARTGQAAVPEKVIRDMAQKYRVGLPASPYPPAVPVPLWTPEGEDLPRAIICDLDGTLSLLNGRDPYDASTCDQDLLNVPVRTVLEVFYRTQNDRIIYLSGREDQYRPQTETFMRKHHCPPGDLFMRRTGDSRKDWMVKGELFDAHVRGRYNVRFVLDDRNQVVDYWRHLGLTCFQVAPGAF